MIGLSALLQSAAAASPPAGGVVRVLTDSLHVTVSTPPSHPNPWLTYLIPGAAALAALLLPYWQRRIAQTQMDAQATLAGRQMDAQATLAGRQLDSQLRIAERNLGAQVLSANRMKWVEHMRLTMAEFLGKRAAFIRRRKDGTIPAAEFHERVEALAVLSYTIILSLTPGDDEHEELATLLGKAIGELNGTPAAVAAEASTSVRLQSLTQKLLKDAWEAAKRIE